MTKMKVISISKKKEQNVINASKYLKQLIYAKVPNLEDRLALHKAVNSLLYTAGGQELVEKSTVAEFPSKRG